MNERDSEAVSAQFLERGFSLAPTEHVADVILLNTCSVRDAAEQKALGKMKHTANALQKKRPDVVLGYLGCMAQSRAEKLLEESPGVRLVVGTQKFHRTAEHVETLLAGRSKSIVDTGEEAGSQNTIREHLPTGQGSAAPVTGFVSIMQGCNQYCTFCIVPYTRGEERSRPIDEIVAECRNLVEHGAREITLLGQIVTSYGKREIGVKEGRSAFVQLLDAVSAIEGLERIRFTSPHPKGYGDDLIEAYARLPKLCEWAHIPVQSGSNGMLKAMHRGYTRERFLEIIRKLRATKPEIGITTDMIVGFPGETEEDLAESMSLVTEADFDNAYIFKYSQRKDTPAAGMPGQHSEEVIEERHTRLLNHLNACSAARYEAYVGRTVQILVEGPSRRNAARMEGRTRSNKIVVFDGSERHRSQLMDLKITRSGSFTLYGDPAIVNLD